MVVLGRRRESVCGPWAVSPGIFRNIQPGPSGAEISHLSRAYYLPSSWSQIMEGTRVSFWSVVCGGTAVSQFENSTVSVSITIERVWTFKVVAACWLGSKCFMASGIMRSPSHRMPHAQHPHPSDCSHLRVSCFSIMIWETVWQRDRWSVTCITSHRLHTHDTYV